MDSPPTDTSRPPTRMASIPCSPIRYETGRGLLDDDIVNDNLSNCSNSISLSMTDTQIDPLCSADIEGCISSKDEQDTTHGLSPISQSSRFNGEDSVELNNVDAAPSTSDARDESDTIDDIMNMPYTTVVPTPVQDFSSLYPSDESVSVGTKQMRGCREQVQEKLKEQLLAEEKESRVSTLGELTELYAPQNSYCDNENGSDGSDILNGLDGTNMQRIKVEAEYYRRTWLELYTLLNDPEPLTPSGDMERQTPACFPARSLSAIDLTSDPCTTLQAPEDYISSANSSRKLSSSSRSSGSKTTSPSKRRRKASSPDELAEIARKAAIEEAEAKEEADLKELEKYREMDLAPWEPIMESKTAGDLLVYGTPVKGWDTEIFHCKYRTPNYKSPQTSSSQKPKGDAEFQLQTPPRCSIAPIERDETPMDINKSDAALPNAEEHQVIPHTHHHPPFITVIETLPATIFWCTVAAFMRCSMNAFDALVERLTGLSVGDTQSFAK